MDIEPHRSRSKEIGGDTSEIDMTMLNQLVTELRFEETPDLAQARQVVIAALSDTSDNPPRTSAVWREYFDIGERIVDETAGPIGPYNLEERAGMHLALLIHEALIFREIGDHIQYIRALALASDFALRANYPLISSGIGEVISLVRSHE